MKPKLILSVLKIGATILFYFLLLITVFIGGNYLYGIFNKDASKYLKVENGNFNNLFIDLNTSKNNSFLYSNNRAIRYKTADNLYSLELKSDSSAGYYYMASILVFLSLGLVVLWNFKEVFKEIHLNNPFRPSVVRRLQLLAIVFIASDVLSFLNYFIIDALISNSMHEPRLKLLTQNGNGILIGLITLIIAVTYKRGLEIYEENQLTV